MFNYTLIVIVVSLSLLTGQTLDQKLQSIKTTYQLAGLSVAVVKNDSIVFNGSYGLRDIQRNLPVTDSTIYRIASISKTITAAALMILYDRGLFQMDDDVSFYLPFVLRNPNYPNEVITIRKILNHTSSLRDGTGYDGFLSATYNNTPPPHLQSLLKQGGAYYSSDMFSSSRGPSSGYFTYANINYGVAGTLVENISGERFDLFVKREIMDKLGVNASFNIQHIQNINNVAVLYRKSGSSWVPQADNYNGVMPPPRDLSSYSIGTNGVIFGPQGGLRISSQSLAKFMMMLMNNGVYNGVRILSDTTAQMMRNVSWVYNGSNGNNYYGIFNNYAAGCHRTTELLPGEILYGHPGEAYGLISDMYFSTVKDYGIVFITNGGVWGYGTYSGWYNVEEDVYKAVLASLPSFTTDISDTEKKVPGDELFVEIYPNPFNAGASITIEIDNTYFTMPKVVLFTAFGEKVADFPLSGTEHGKIRIQFDPSRYNLSSGMYFLSVTAGNNNKTLPMLLMK